MLYKGIIRQRQNAVCTSRALRTLHRFARPLFILHFAFCILHYPAWGADWIAVATHKDTPIGCFRKTIVNASAVTSGTLKVTAGGTFYAYLNGKRIGNDFLAPGFTSSNKRRIVMTYDLTPLLKTAAGETNELAIEVAPTWFADAITRGNGNFGQGAPSFFGEMILTYTDGTRQTFPTDTSWRAAYAGEILDCGIYEGERVDTRFASDWRTAPVTWPRAITNVPVKLLLAPEEDSVPRIRPDLTLKPISAKIYCGTDNAADDRYGTAHLARTCRPDGPYMLKAGEKLIVDFGQNHAGIPAFTVEGSRGTRLLVRFAEMLNDGAGRFDRGNDGPEGLAYLANLRKSAARVEYTHRGGRFTYEPRFTFFGYRYAQFEATDDLILSDLVAKVVTSVRARKGSIETGDARINRLIKNCEWGHLSNYLSVPTDCPQRDERIGWCGDTQVFSLTGMYCADVYGFFMKWMRDLTDIQLANGAFTDIAPPGAWMPAGGGTGWSDAGIIVPYNAYLMYGRDDIIRQHWNALRNYAQFLRTNHGPLDRYGDWLVIGRENNADMKRILSASFWIWDTRMLTTMARAINQKDDAAQFAKDEADALKNYRDHYLDETGFLKPQFRCQTAYAYAAKLNLLPKARLKAAFKEEFAKFDNHLATGFLGTAILLDALTDEGLDDLAVTVLLQPTYPGWLYSVEQGATTIWERWNTYTKEKGFGPADMNSFNHYAYGAVLGWMYSRLAGIRPSEAAPGFRHFILAPHPDQRLGHCNATYDSAAGRIESSWNFDTAGKLHYRFTIPNGTTATLRLTGHPEETLPPGTYTR